MPSNEAYKDKVKDLRLQIMRQELRKTKAEASVKEHEAAYEGRRERDSFHSLNNSQIYHFFGPVNGGQVQDCITWLGLWARRSELLAELTVVFNSPGGNVIDGFALYDYMEHLKEQGHTINTVTRGYAASMGGILLQAGNERVIGANAHILIHEISSIGMGKVSEIEEELAFLRRLQKKALAILAGRSTMTADQIGRKWKKKDWWIDAVEAVDLGFADRVG